MLTLLHNSIFLPIIHYAFPGYTRHPRLYERQCYSPQELSSAARSRALSECKDPDLEIQPTSLSIAAVLYCTCGSSPFCLITLVHFHSTLAAARLTTRPTTFP
jgi:hypothetical protein